MNYNLITILGPTAAGKTRLGARLAYIFNGEIISADSRQVYKGMDIGTGKDYDDYLVNGERINYHLVDILSPAEEYNLYHFREHFKDAFYKIQSRGKLPFLAGGTGLYLDSILHNYRLIPASRDIKMIEELRSKDIDELREMLLMLDPKPHNTTDLRDKERIIKAVSILRSNISPEDFPEINSLVIGVHINREEVKKRITARLQARLENGMIEEVKRLNEEGVTFERLDSFGLEYRYIGLYLQDKLSYDEMFRKLNTSIHQFSKRQMTWFRKMEREGIKINWIEGPDADAAAELIKSNFINE